MDLLKPLVKHITYPFFLNRDARGTRSYQEALEKSQWLSPGDIRAMQLMRLRNLLIWCRDRNGFYRDRMAAVGLVPEDMSDLSQLGALPVLTKDDIRAHGDELFSRGYSRENTFHKRTGGSTGVPLHIYQNFEAVAEKRGATLRHNTWAGLQPGDRLAAVWGDTDKPIPLKERMRNALTDRAFYLDTLKFDDDHILTFLRQIRQLRPTVMMGHAHSIFRLAEYVRDNSCEPVSFRGIITTAMVLSPEERETIETVFSSPVFNRYGCEELSIIASESDAHTGLHVFAEGLVVETVDESSSLPGRLVITDLLNRAMPLIRYEIGDCGRFAAGDCPSGRGLPRLKEVSGRTADFLYTPDRKPVFGISILDTFVIHIPGFKQVQIVQNRYESLEFFIVKDTTFSQKSLELLGKNVREIFGPDMKYEIHYVDTIKQTERGKFRFSICNLSPGEDS